MESYWTVSHSISSSAFLFLIWLGQSIYWQMNRYTEWLVTTKTVLNEWLNEDRQVRSGNISPINWHPMMNKGMLKERSRVQRLIEKTNPAYIIRRITKNLVAVAPIPFKISTLASWCLGNALTKIPKASPNWWEYYPPSATVLQTV